MVLIMVSTHDKIVEFTTLKICESYVESLKDVKASADEWKVYYRVQQILVRFPKPQPQHVDEQEAEAIKDLREHHKYSISDLAFIFDRSKATIHDVLNRQ